MIKELPEPDELRTAIEATASEQHLSRQSVAEEFKLRYHFGGQSVICLRTAEGIQVVAAGIPGSGELYRALESLPPWERKRAVVRTVDPWGEQDRVATAHEVSSRNET